MAVCYRVEERDDLARMFAAHDLYSSLLNNLFGRTLTPDDDFYAAPWAFLPDQGDGIGAGRGGYVSGHVVWTCRVPWLHGRGGRERHLRRAREVMMRECGDAMVPHVDTAEAMQDFLLVDEDEVFAFTRDGCYPSGEDISQALEDKAVRVTCGAMGWEVPNNWREEREREREFWCVDEIFDLAEHDANRKNGTGGNKRMKFSPEPFASLISHSDGSGEHEEKRCSSHDGHDAGRGRPTRDPIDPYATLIPPLHCRQKQGPIRPPRLDRGSCESYGSDDRNFENHLETFYDEDARVVDDKGGWRRPPPRPGYEYEYEYTVDSRHEDSFYDEAGRDEDGQIEV